MLRGLVILVAVLAASTSQRFPQASDAPFLVAALQSNGAMLPFAAFNGKTWSAPWPEPFADADRSIRTLPDLPTTWTSGLPIAGEWRLWLPTDTAHRLNVTAATFFKGVCGSQWALTTDFPAVVDQCRNCCPTGTIGVATTGTRAVMRMSRSPRDYAPLLDARGPGLVVEHAWQSGLLHNGTLHYVEAVRELGTCQVELTQAWLREIPSRTTEIRAIQIHRTVTDCDRKGESSFRPLGVVTIGAADYALVERLGWASQDYGVIRIDAATVAPVVMARAR